MWCVALILFFVPWTDNVEKDPLTVGLLFQYINLFTRSTFCYLSLPLRWNVISSPTCTRFFTRRYESEYFRDFSRHHNIF